LGLLYKGQYYFSSLVTPYNKEVLRSNGAVSKVMAFFDYFENQFHTILQGGTNSFGTYAARNFSFNEGRNGFCSDDYDFHPEWAIGADDKVYTWQSGALWKHDTVNGSGAAVPYCNFYEVQYGVDLTVVFNPDIGMKKGWQSVAEVASTTWACPEIYTSTNSYGTQRQESTLVSAEFRTLEGMPSASFKRDANSRGGKINGDFLKGYYMVVKFQVASASDLVNLSELIVRYIDSPLNVK